MYSRSQLDESFFYFLFRLLERSVGGDAVGVAVVVAAAPSGDVGTVFSRVGMPSSEVAFSDWSNCALVETEGLRDSLDAAFVLWARETGDVDDDIMI